VRVGKYLIHTLFKWSLKRDALSSLLFNFAVGYATKNVQESLKLLELVGIHQLLVFADAVGMSG
jgi:hypothetical protein